MNVIWILAAFTILAVAAFGGYTLLSHRRLEKHDGNAKGVGGVNDPLAGAKPLGRSPREMTESIKAANNSGST